MELARCGLRLADVERQHILETLIRCHGNRTFAAKQLGISLRGLRIKLHDYAASGCPVCEPKTALDQFLCERTESPLAPCRRR